MNTNPPNSRRLRPRPNPSLFLPDELIPEILSWLPVKSLMQMKSVSHTWNTLISDPKFIKMHLHRSARNPYFWYRDEPHDDYNYTFLHFPVSRVLQNHWITVPKDPYYLLNDKDCEEIVGSCNGLVCLLGEESFNYENVWFRFWNPATRKISDKLGYKSSSMNCTFVFCYDNSTDIYKVLELSPSGSSDLQPKTTVRVFSLADNLWRTIQSFPVVPLVIVNPTGADGVHLGCTVNWLANKSEWRNDSIGEFVILSFDIGREKYTQLQLPQGFDNDGEPSICVLKDSLFFYYNDFMKTGLVIWKMKEFGNENSWTQFHKVSYHNIRTNYKYAGRRLIKLRPMHLSENGETMVLADIIQDQAILYNLRTNKAKKTRINKKISWFLMQDYVESLVSTS